MLVPLVMGQTCNISLLLANAMSNLRCNYSTLNDRGQKGVVNSKKSRSLPGSIDTSFKCATAIFLSRVVFFPHKTTSHAHTVHHE